MIVSVRPRVLGLLLVATFVLVVVAPRQALGCSCMEPIDPGALLDEADAAFVGSMVGRHQSDEFQAEFLFEVEDWVKADLGRTVWVHSGSNSAMCGFEQPTGQRIGLLLHFDGENLTSSICSMLDPDLMYELRESHVPAPDAVAPLPPEAIGLSGDGSGSDATTTARIALGALVAAALAGLVVTRLRRRSAPEQ